MPAPSHPTILREVLPLPTLVAVLLGLFWLAVLMVVAFTGWRLVGNVRSLLASVQALGERLTPVLEELASESQEAAEHAARLADRGSRQAREA
jgi:hypothetical protein